MRHADRCTTFSRPLADAEIGNAMAGQLADLPPGRMLVYHLGPAGIKSERMKFEAARAATSQNCALVQWPNAAPGEAGRTWCYAIQKPA